MRVLIIANGKLNEKIPNQDNTLIIAADGGTKYCIEQNIIPSVIIGDLDSLQPETVHQLQELGTEVIQYPSRKDYTDLELALSYAYEKKPEEIVIYGALGERWDQTIANILLPVLFPSIPITLIDQNQELHFIHKESPLTIHGEPGDTVSLIPLRDNVKCVSTKGLEYHLENETLIFGKSRGVSNQLLANTGEISLSDGVLLCSIIHLHKASNSN